MANFDKAFEMLLKHECGYVDNIVDKGGSTNYGITLESWSNYLKKSVTKEDIKNITISEAKDYYYKEYWLKNLIDEIANDAIATSILDLGVLRGINTVIKDSQYILGLKSDGIIGPKTLQLLNIINPKVFCTRLIEKTQLSFLKICFDNPSQLQFIIGWINRTHDLLNLTLNN